MTKYRFFRIDGLHVYYLHQNKTDYVDRRHAGVFSEDDWESWGAAMEWLQREALGEDEMMRRSGAARLPGLEE